MIPVKIQCACGQRYAFEVEPVGGRMPSAVACPACGADGTAAANAAIAQSLAAQPPVAARPVGILLSAPAPAPPAAPVLSAPPPLTVAPPPTVAPAPPAAPRRPAPLPGQLDRTSAEREARAKISWGDAPEDVTRFLMMQGLDYEEASVVVRGLVRERAATIRRNGIGKILIGCVLVPVPIVTISMFVRTGYIPITPVALTVMVGVWGAWMLLKGTFMLLAPKSESGDIADQ